MVVLFLIIVLKKYRRVGVYSFKISLDPYRLLTIYITKVRISFDICKQLLKIILFLFLYKMLHN